MHDLVAAASMGDLVAADSVEAGFAVEPCSTVADGAGAVGAGAEVGSVPAGGVGAGADGVAPGGVGGVQAGDGGAQVGDGADADLAPVGGGLGSAGPRDQPGPTTATMAAGGFAGTTSRYS